MARDFLREYDARKKIQRGVFYTPQPVVSYIVRSVHELLQTEFGLEDAIIFAEMVKRWQINFRPRVAVGTCLESGRVTRRLNSLCDVLSIVLVFDSGCTEQTCPGTLISF